MIKCTVLLFLLAGLSCYSIPLHAQPKSYSTGNAHSHNDYEQDTAFFKAYRYGFGSIEADVFPSHNELFVAHNRKDIREERTLSKLYLEPLKKGLLKDIHRKVQLLIDIKENSDTVLPLLVRQLKPLQPFYLSGRLTILISGNRPLPSRYYLYPAYFYFDDDLVKPHSKKEWKRVGLVSLQFSIFTNWKGVEPIPAKEEDRLRRIINAVHASGKRIRFWDAPDNIRSWKEQMFLGVDFVGTDHIKELADLLQAENK